MPPVRKKTALWKCVVVMCETDCRKGTAHRIPKNADKANLWVKSLGNPELCNLGVAELNKYRVCSRHFASTDYLLQTRKPTLKEGVIPSLRLPVSIDVDTLDSSGFGFQESSCNSLHNVEGKLAKPLLCSSNREAEQKEPVRKPNEDVSTTVRLKRKRPLGSHSAGLSKRERYLTQKARDLRAAVAVCKKRALTYRQRLQQAKQFFENNSLEAFTEKLTEKQFIFFRMQLRNNGTSPRGRRFTLEEKLLALSWMKASGRGYRLLQSQFQLPSTRTLTSLLNKSPLDSGISKKVIRALKNKVAALKDPQDKFVTLMWDEIKLDAHLQYDRKLDKIIGFEDSGNRRTSTLADHALVFMIRGIKNNWKMPLSFTFCASQTKTAQLVELIKLHVKILQKVGLTVIATVCDQGTSNVAAINSLEKECRRVKLKNGIEFDPSVILIYGMTITPIFDPPHLLKCLRNNLLTKDLEFEPLGQVNKQRHFAKWSHLELLYNLDLYAETDNQRLWRLTKSHVDRRLIKKMRVKYAAQVFSKTCATFLAMAAQYGSKTSTGTMMPREAADTSRVLAFVNDLFDSVNGSSRPVERINNLRSAVTLTSEHKVFWGDARKRLQKMRFVTSDNHRPVKVIPCLENWNRSLNGFQRIWKRLLVEEKFSSFSPRNINQDCLENFFGSIRSHGWRNVNPSCTQFSAAYHSLVVNSISFPHARRANCEDDQGDMLRDLNCMMENQSVEPVTDNDSIDELPLPVESCHEQSTSQSIFYDTMQSYAASCIAKKLLKYSGDCTECKKCMLAGNSYTDNNDPCRILIPDINNFHHVNSVFVASVQNCKEFLKSVLPAHCFRRKLLTTLHSKLSQNEPVIWSTCIKHAAAIKSKFLEILILSQVDAFCTNVNRILAGKYDRALYSENFVFRQARTYRFKHSQHRNNV